MPTGTPATEEQKDGMVEMYLAGAGLLETARHFGFVDGHVCHHALESRGFKPKARAKTIKSEFVTSAQKARMVVNYERGLSVQKVTVLEGLSEYHCRRALKEQNVTMRSLSEAQRLYTADETFFDEIATEEQAYWLGMLSADVNVSGSVSRFVLDLKRQDRGHLQKLKIALCATNPICPTNRKSANESNAITIYSDHLVSALVRLGVVPRKSHTLRSCVEIPALLLRHYWRGLVDGDGSVGGYFANNRRNRDWRISLAGTRSIVESFREFVRCRTGREGYLARDGKCFSVTFTGNISAQMTAYLLYGKATVFLDRKKGKVDELLSIPTKFTTWLETALDDEIELWFKHGESAIL